MLDRARRVEDEAFDALHTAYARFCDVADELRSDWPPGWELSDRQLREKNRMVATVAAAKATINDLKNGAGR